MKETVMVPNKLKIILSVSLFVFIALQVCSSKGVKCPQVDILNIAFQEFPHTLARLKISHKEALALKTKYSDETSTKKLFLDNSQPQHGETLSLESPTKQEHTFREDISLVFGPIKDFLIEIRRCSFLMSPLLETSLTDKIAKKSYLIKFMHSSTDPLEFFEHELTTKEKLLEACEELGIFCQDLEDSLSEDTHKKYREFVHEVRQAKKECVHEEVLALQLFDLKEIGIHDQIMHCKIPDTIPVLI